MLSCPGAPGASGRSRFSGATCSIETCRAGGVLPIYCARLCTACHMDAHRFSLSCCRKLRRTSLSRVLIVPQPLSRSSPTLVCDASNFISSSKIPASDRRGQKVVAHHVIRVVFLTIVSYAARAVGYVVVVNIDLIGRWLAQRASFFCVCLLCLHHRRSSIEG